MGLHEALLRDAFMVLASVSIVSVVPSSSSDASHGIMCEKRSLNRHEEVKYHDVRSLRIKQVDFNDNSKCPGRTRGAAQKVMSDEHQGRSQGDAATWTLQELRGRKNHLRGCGLFTASSSQDMGSKSMLLRPFPTHPQSFALPVPGDSCVI